MGLLVDHYDADWSRLWWVRVDGTAAVHEPHGALRGRALDALAAKYPPYAATRPAGPLLVITPTRVGRLVGDLARRARRRRRERRDGGERGSLTVCTARCPARRWIRAGACGRDPRRRGSTVSRPGQVGQEAGDRRGDASGVLQVRGVAAVEQQQLDRAGRRVPDRGRRARWCRTGRRCPGRRAPGSEIAGQLRRAGPRRGTPGRARRRSSSGRRRPGRGGGGPSGCAGRRRRSGAGPPRSRAARASSTNTCGAITTSPRTSAAAACSSAIDAPSLCPISTGRSSPSAVPQRRHHGGRLLVHEARGARGRRRVGPAVPQPGVGHRPPPGGRRRSAPGSRATARPSPAPRAGTAAAPGPGRRAGRWYSTRPPGTAPCAARAPAPAHSERLVQPSHQLLRGDLPVGVGDDLGDLVPVHLVVVEPDAEPAATADVRRPEEPVRAGGDQRLLRAGRGGAPEPDPVVVVVVGVGHEDLAHEPGRLAVAGLLGDLGQGQAERAQPGQRVGHGRREPDHSRRASMATVGCATWNAG